MLILIVTIAIMAIVFDLLFRRIPNVLTVAAALLGLFLHALWSGMPGFLNSLGGLGLGFGVLLVFYLMGGMGAGDVKLMGGMGALLGVELTEAALIYTALVGGVMAVATVTANRAWKDTLYRLLLLVTLRGKIPDGPEGLKGLGPGRLTIPYGVAIGIGSLLAALLGRIY